MYNYKTYIMKVILLILLLSFSFFAYSQKNNLSIINEKSEVKITAVSYAVNSAKELQSIDSREIKEVFNSNKGSEKIEMSFALNYPNSKYKIKSSIKVSGQTKDIDSLIFRAKKGVKSIIKISNKYKN